jgi:hypothetical protein
VTLLAPAATAGAGGVPGASTCGVTSADGKDAAEVPPVFVALALNVYAVPFVKPVTSQDQGVTVTVHFLPYTTTFDWYAVTVKDVGVPPGGGPAVTVTVTIPSPATPMGAGGFPGTDTKVTTETGAEASEWPAAFVAKTVNVYEVPFVSPVTRIVPETAWDKVPMMPPVSEVAVYSVIAEPPLETGWVKLTVAVVDPVAVAAPMVGAPGTVTGVTGADGADTAEVPPAFVAVTVNVYAVPLVRPVTSQDPDSPVTVHAPPVTAGDAVTA